MNYLILEILTDNLLNKKQFKILESLKHTNKNTKNIINKNNLYLRIRSAELLKKVILNLNTNIEHFWETKYQFNLMLSNIFNIESFMYDRTYSNYKINIADYSKDKLNPFKNLRIFKYKEFKNEIKNSNSILLKLALDHAENPYSIAKAREINNYFYY